MICALRSAQIPTGGWGPLPTVVLKHKPSQLPRWGVAGGGGRPPGTRQTPALGGEPGTLGSMAGRPCLLSLLLLQGRVGVSPWGELRVWPPLTPEGVGALSAALRRETCAPTPGVQGRAPPRSPLLPLKSSRFLRGLEQRLAVRTGASPVGGRLASRQGPPEHRLAGPRRGAGRGCPSPALWSPAGGRVVFPELRAVGAGC